MKNYELELVMRVLNGPDSVMRKGRFTPATRQAWKIFFNNVKDRFQIYQDCRQEIVQEFVTDGKAKQEGDRITFGPEYVKEINDKLVELSIIQNEMKLLPKEAADEILQNPMTLEEEEVIELITEKPKEE